MERSTRLARLSLGGFRCFSSLEYEPGERLSFLTGPNARGKTSLLEAACVLLRLKSPRTSDLSELVRFGGGGFRIEGRLPSAPEGWTRLSLAFTPPVRSLSIDGVAQSGTADYLSVGRIVWFGSDDLRLVNGPAEGRRKLLDSAGLQISASYGRDLRAYDRALRSRNLLLREGRPRREVEAYDRPLCEAGERILAARESIVRNLAPMADHACRGISGEPLELVYRPGSSLPMIDSLRATREEEIRVRMTRTGPQRDDVGIRLGGIDAGPFASEGQRRTVALALKLALASLLSGEGGAPLLLLDDIFGELDPPRRDALLAGMPPGSQALVTTADLGGIALPEGSVVHRFAGAGLERVR